MEATTEAPTPNISPIPAAIIKSGAVIFTAVMAQRYADEHECPNCGFKGGLVVSQSDCDKYECLNCGHRGSFDQEIVDRNDVESEWLSSYTEEEREEVYDKDCSEW